VTHLPPLVLGYRRVGRLMQIGTSAGSIKDHYPSEYLNALQDK
jgi:hypothetical protein